MKNSTIRLSLAVAFALSLQNYALADNANLSADSAKITNRGGAERVF